MLTIRRETPEDYQAVEDLTRKAFYNQYLPGCVEHYLIRLMRNHEDFIPELALVAELGGIVLTAFYQLLINKTQRSPLLGRCVFCWGKGRITP